MKWDIREPCKSCPYRKDAKPGFWSAQEFIDLQANDRRDEHTSPLYGCHGSNKQPEPTVCAGWLMDQRARHVPNIRLRLMLATQEEALECYEQVDCTSEMYDSIEDMARANYKAILDGSKT